MEAGIPRTLIDAVRFFKNPNRCREFMAMIRWPDGVKCPTCGSDKVGFLTNQNRWQCSSKHPKRQFSLKVGTIFEDSPIGLDKWLPTVWMIANMKNGVSSHEIGRALGVTQKTAWFMLHRIRLAMQALVSGGKLGGTVEVDETYIGRLKGQPKRRGGGTHKNTVVTLVERGGGARSFHIYNATIANIAPIVRENIRRESGLMTDESNLYREVGSEFESHDAVNHGEEEYVRYPNVVSFPDGEPRPVITTNTVEGFYSIFKRGMKGIYQHCSEKHLHRYLSEFDFRYSNRIALGVNDIERAERALKGIVGKRLTYRTARH